MPFSFLNGLGAMGASVAQFAGSAGLELQRSQLSQQAQILADQLATTRETGLQDKRLAAQSGEKALDRTAAREALDVTEGGANTRSAASNATSASNNAATIAAGLKRTQMEIDAPTPTEKLFKFLQINPDGSPKNAAAPAANTSSAPRGGTDSTSPQAPTSDMSGSTSGASTPARSIGADLVDKALGRPSPGSPEATRYAIAQDVAKEHPYWTAGQKATETERLVGEASGLGRPRYSFSAPVTLPDPDDPSKTISGVNRQNTKDGSIEFVRTDTNPNRPGEGGIGNRAEVVHQRVASAATMAAEAAKNIMELPAGSSTGWFGGREQGRSLMGALKESLTNSVTSQEVQSYNVMLSGVARNLSTIETSGLAPNAGFTKSMDSVVLKEGDSEITKMRKMAEIRQIVEFGLEPSLANPRLPDVQKNQLRSVIEKIKDSIPFTHHDITVLDKSPGKTTMNDVMKARGLGGGAADDTTAPARADRNAPMTPNQMYGGTSTGAPAKTTMPPILRYDATGNRISP